MFIDKTNLNFLKSQRNLLKFRKANAGNNVAIVDISSLVKKNIDSIKEIERPTIKTEPLDKQFCTHCKHEIMADNCKWSQHEKAKSLFIHLLIVWPTLPEF